VVSGGDGMDSLLEYILTDARGFLSLRPFMSCVRPMLLVTRSGWCLSVRRKPPSTLDQGPGSLPRADKRGGKGGQVEKSCPPMLNCKVENQWCG
jgi:hypothetical protein